MSHQEHYQVISKNKLSRLHECELERFHAARKKSAALLKRGQRSMIKGVPMSWMYGLYRHPSLFVEAGSGSAFRDVDGNEYIDFNVVDLAMTMGFANPYVNAAVHRAMETGAHFLLPVEESIQVAEELARRTGVPYWQFTLSASGANAEVVRIARAMTGRGKVMVFDGHYHGHLDDTLVEKLEGKVRPSGLGLPKGIELNVEIVPFNDLAAAEAILSREEIAVVITEPALSNCTLVKPEPGFLSGLHELTHRYGSLLCLDEAHTFSFAFGGLKRAWRRGCREFSMHCSYRGGHFILVHDPVIACKPLNRAMVRKPIDRLTPISSARASCLWQTGESGMPCRPPDLKFRSSIPKRK